MLSMVLQQRRARLILFGVGLKILQLGGLIGNTMKFIKLYFYVISILMVYLINIGIFVDVQNKRFVFLFLYFLLIFSSSLFILIYLSNEEKIWHNILIILNRMRKLPVLIFSGISLLYFVYVAITIEKELADYVDYITYIASLLSFLTIMYELKTQKKYISKISEK